jgi:hypothetical protein
MVAALEIATALLFLAFSDFPNYRASIGCILAIFQHRFLFLLRAGLAMSENGLELKRRQI